MGWPRRLLNLARARRTGAEIDRELAFHLEEKTEALMAQGLSRAEAARRARLQLGHLAEVREDTRETDVLGWLESALADLRYAVRSLKASPGFTVVAIASLGLGIGANTAIFSLFNAVLLKSIPVPRAKELVQVVHQDGNPSFTNPLWEAVAGTPGGGSLFAFGSAEFDLATGGEVRPAGGAYVSGGYFPVLEVHPSAGRLLQRSDDFRGCPVVTVLGSGFARREFGSPEGALGRTITLGGAPAQVIGVVPAAFYGMEVGQSVEVYLPICAQEALSGSRSSLDGRSNWWLNVFGRLPAGLGVAALSARLAAVAPGVFASTVPERWGPKDQERYRAGTLSARAAAFGTTDMRQAYGRALGVLLGVVAAVLLIACANVAHLLLARGAARQREIAVRLAIGAGWGRLIRQLLTEGLLLGLAGAATGLAFARWASALLVTLLQSGTRTVSLELSLDLRVLGFTALAALATGVVFGLVPAWTARRVQPQQAMRAQGRAITAPRSRLTGGRVLVVGQVALSLVLLVGAGLLLGSFRRLVTLDPGFRREGLTLLEVSYGRSGFDEARMRTAHQQLLARLRGTPGVTQASASFTTPVGNRSWNDFIEVPGYTPKDDEDRLIWFNSVSDGWFATLGTDLLAGRDFSPADGTGGARVAVVNEAMARKYFGPGSPLGRTFRTVASDGSGQPMEVVGVVRNTAYQTLKDEAWAIAYVPEAQADWFGNRMSYQIRSRLDPAALRQGVTAVARDIHPALTLRFSSMEDQVAGSLSRPRLLATLSGFFGALALLLAVVGLYGTVAYGVERRRTEIGIRLALGAARGRVLRLVIREAALLVAGGVALGVAGAVGASRLVESFLYGVTPRDGATFLVAAGLLGAVALAASAIPAWRAATLDPTTTLREE